MVASADEITRRLEELYGRPEPGEALPPLDELVLTILSQHTSDTNSLRAFRSLKERFPRWDDVRVVPLSDVADAIRSGGLAELKAGRIQTVVGRVLDEGTLDDLSALPLSEAKARLTALPGVGPKTAACVLLFACGLPALPVDTHVYRVARRLGLIDAVLSAEAAHEALESQLDPTDVYSFHVNMIRHGRTVCRARGPLCDRCGVNDCCAAFQTARQTMEYQVLDRD